MPPFPRHQLLTLYSQFMHTSNSFASYNFKEYFLRRSRHKFCTELPQVLGILSTKTQPLLEFDESSLSTEASPSQLSQPSAASTSTVTLDESNHARLVSWMKEAQQELDSLKRAASTNSMYRAPTLVVEGRGRLIANAESESE